MAKATRVMMDPPPAPYALLEQAAHDNAINTASAGFFVLQAVVAWCVSDLVPKLPKPTQGGSRGQTAVPAATDTSMSVGLPDGHTTQYMAAIRHSACDPAI